MSPEVLGVFVPIVAIVFGVSVAIVYIIAAHRQRLQRAELRHRERLAAIDKGLEIPPDAAEPVAARPTRPRFLLRGLMFTFSGIALTFAIDQIDGGDAPSRFGMVLTAIGLAYLVYYWIEGRHESKLLRADRPPEAPPAS